MGRAAAGALGAGIARGAYGNPYGNNIQQQQQQQQQGMYGQQQMYGQNQGMYRQQGYGQQFGGSASSGYHP